MTKQEFKNFCKQEFYKREFKKVKKMYYLDGKENVLCGIDLQKSNFGNYYYINVSFFIKELNMEGQYPSYYDSDIDGRISVMSKDTYQGEIFMTSQIEYEKYTPEELSRYFEKDFKEWILPAVEEGTSFIAQKLDYKNLSPHPAREEEVLKFLKLKKEDICSIRRKKV